MLHVRIGIPNQTDALEQRVALTPELAKRFTDVEIILESGAGQLAGFPDETYHDVARIASPEEVWASDLVVIVKPPTAEEQVYLQPGSLLLGLLEPLDHPEVVARLATSGVTSLAFELVPRTTRAQSMDALSSQATAVGYQACLLASQHLQRFLPMLTTAAGTIKPAKVLILGAGVAGLQAIATARRLGAVVAAFDVRAAAAEQVQSLGATFIDMSVSQDETAAGGYAQEVSGNEQQQILQTLAPHVATADIVITTAQIPGRPAPLLITADMVKSMPPGSIIIDTAAATGGNCELTMPDERVESDGVSIFGPTNLASQVAGDASRMYARNVWELAKLATATIPIDLEDDILAGCVVTHDGKVVHPRVLTALGQESA